MKPEILNTSKQDNTRLTLKHKITETLFFFILLLLKSKKKYLANTFCCLATENFYFVASCCPYQRVISDHVSLSKQPYSGHTHPDDHVCKCGIAQVFWHPTDEQLKIPLEDILRSKTMPSVLFECSTYL